VVRRAGARGPAAAFRELHPRVHRAREVLAAAVRAPGPAVIGDRHPSRRSGATITHRVLSRLFRPSAACGRPHLPDQLRRQHRLPQHAGAAKRLESQKKSPKTSAVTSINSVRTRGGRRPRRPQDYIPWLKDRKWCHNPHGRARRSDVPLNLELSSSVGLAELGPASSSTRCAARSWAGSQAQGRAGSRPSSYFKKSRRCRSRTTRRAR